MQKSYDAVIIGAGHNSLACAAHLAAKGWSVGVFEQASVPGGAVKTLELTEPGFRHDWAAMNVSLFAGSAFFKAYSEELTRHGLAFAPAENCFASVFEDGTWLGLGNDAAANMERIAAFSEADAAAWKRLTDGFPARAEHIFALLGSPMKLHVFARFMLKLFMRAGHREAMSLVRFLLASPRAFLTETFEDERVRATLAAWGMHLDFAPDIAGGALFPYLEGMANQSFGMVLGQGGADTVVKALVGMIEDRGGAVHCGQRVARIVRKGGAAVGVELEDGTRIDAQKAVIAGSAPSRLVGDLLEGGSGDKAFDAGMAGFQHAPGTMMIHLAMDDLPDWSAGEALRSYAYVHLAPSLDQMARAYQEARAGLLPKAPVIVAGQPTAVDPSRAPEGKHVMWLQVRMAPGTVKGDAAGTIEGTDWEAIKGPFAERVIDIIEGHAPGLRDKIIARRIVSPEELEADNPNLVGGDQVCGSHHLTQHFFFRPAYGHANGETPITNLHLTGAAVWPGAGLGAGSGYLLGRRLAGN
ncbi:MULTISPECIES: NAD(P)/FAD-dependent oxidoreductase [unclassified Roseitalea]|uniref:phytoene desaturase family protein n=1 Tax=unclassified Roseitalea TaxID=2639107 RepID=UPI00273DE7B0|nr:MULTISPECIES: NAD(P)/FAD-dependent oxidoreductase [unclassified Roseitalea]